MATRRIIQLSADASKSIPLLVKEEGGYTSNKNDQGNFFNGQLVGTKYGITGNAYKSFYNSSPTADTIKNLTIPQATPIYKKNYWDKIRGDEIANDSVADLMLFSIVNSGTGIIKSLKMIANQTAGKKIMAETATPFTSAEIKLLNALPQDQYFNNLKTARERFYRDLAAKVPADKVFLTGWLNRLNKHVYSGAVSKKSPTKYILIGLGVVVVGGAAVYFYNKRKRTFSKVA